MIGKSALNARHSLRRGIYLSVRGERHGGGNAERMLPIGYFVSTLKMQTRNISMLTIIDFDLRSSSCNPSKELKKVSELKKMSNLFTIKHRANSILSASRRS